MQEIFEKYLGRITYFARIQTQYYCLTVEYHVFVSYGTRFMFYYLFLTFSESKKYFPKNKRYGKLIFICQSI